MATVRGSALYDALDMDLSLVVWATGEMALHLDPAKCVAASKTGPKRPSPLPVADGPSGSK